MHGMVQLWYKNVATYMSVIHVHVLVHAQVFVLLLPSRIHELIVHVAVHFSIVKI